MRVPPDPFDDDDDAFPILIDAGFELLALSELDAERHRGLSSADAIFEAPKSDYTKALIAAAFRAEAVPTDVVRQ